MSANDLTIGQLRGGRMKLSEAIIKGCEGTYQIRRQYNDGYRGCCAIGTALLPRLPSLNVSWWSVFRRRFPVANRTAVHPETGDLMCVGAVIASLNDFHRWPRLSIAEWLANVVEPEFEK